MAQHRQSAALSQVVVLAAGAIIIAGLYFAQDVLIPLALSILFSFLLAPLVRRLERFHLGRIPSVLVVVGLSSGLILGIGYLVTSQAVALTYRLPGYRENIRHKVDALKGRTAGGLTKVQETIKEIGQELTTRPASAPATAIASSAPPQAELLHPLFPAQGTQLSVPAAGNERPVRVEIIEPTSLWQTVRPALGYLAGPLGTAAVAFILVVFMLIQREDLRDRIISLIGRGRIHVTTVAMDDAGQRISRYLLMQLIVNITYGVPIGIALYFIGIPNALLWGLLATLLRYLPYVGPWLAASMPAVLALAIFDDWRHVVMVIAVFLVLELIINNAIEPRLYGNSTGLSTIAILVAAVFWTWLWGPVGLLLSTPMTACIVVMGKYIPQLDFLNVLLGDEPVFEPATRFYQRLLAMDQEEAEDLIEEHLAKGTLLQAYDQFLIPALHIAEQDRHGGRLDQERYEFISSTIRSIVVELGEAKIEAEREAVVSQMRDRIESASFADPQEPASVQSPRPMRLLPEGFSVLCAPAHDEADALTALMFKQVLEANGFQVECITAAQLKSEVVAEIRESAPRIVCISALPPGALMHVRYLCKRLNPVGDDMPIIIGLWDIKADIKKVANQFNCTGAMHFVRTFHEAIVLVQDVARRATTYASSPNTPHHSLA